MWQKLSWPRTLVVFSCLVSMVSRSFLFLVWKFTLVSGNLPLLLVFFSPVCPPVPHYCVYVWSASPFVGCKFVLSCVPENLLCSIVLSRTVSVCSMPLSCQVFVLFFDTLWSPLFLLEDLSFERVFFCLLSLALIFVSRFSLIWVFLGLLAVVAFFRPCEWFSVAL